MDNSVKIIAENGLQVTQEDLDGRLSEYAKQYGMSSDELKKNLTPDDVAYFENEVMMSKLLSFIKEKNKK